MTDVLTEEQRRLNMSRIRAKDTKPELLIRRGLHALGYRYHLHWRALIGRPDMVFPRYKTAVFVHGCFWHGHKCHLFKMPATREDFWRKKIVSNAARDENALGTLRALGWRILIVWECALKGKRRLALDEVLRRTEEFLKGAQQLLELSESIDAHP
jgi:DNA mismatch endonuclease (patch repair protein)